MNGEVPSISITSTINDNCASSIRVTEYLIITACPSHANNTGRITIYERDKTLTDSTLLKLATIDGPFVGARFGLGS